MKFSLIMATLGRTSEVERFLDCLDAQTYRCFELIVVDQNADDRLVHLLDSHRKKFPILHLRSVPGASLARNVGLRHAEGKIVGFPDDDCWYLPHLLERVVCLFQEKGYVDGISGRVADEQGTFDARFDLQPGLLKISNVWQRAAAVCLFLREAAIRQVGDFDEALGPNAGTAWGGGEDIDYALRAVGVGLVIRYEPDLTVLHPNPLKGGYRDMAGRAYSYGAGIGRVWRKHNYPIWLVSYYLMRPIGGSLLSFATGRRDKACYHWSAFRGRLRGWLSRN